MFWECDIYLWTFYSIFCRYSCSGLCGQHSKHRRLDLPFPEAPLPALLGGHQGVPNQPGDIICPPYAQPVLGSLPQSDMLETCHLGDIQEAVRCPSHFNLLVLMWRRNSSTLSPSQLTELLNLNLKQNSCRVCLQSAGCPGMAHLPAVSSVFRWKQCKVCHTTGLWGTFGCVLVGSSPWRGTKL